MGKAKSLALVALVACGSKSEGAPTPEPPPALASFGDAGLVDAGPPECTDDTKDVFVLSEETTIYKFHPPTLELKKLGPLSCPTNGATPTSMAVDRHGFAWVRYSDGSIWKVSTVDLSCAPTTYVPPTPTDAFFKFGMGFSSATAGGSVEQLFLSDASGHGTAALDLATMKVGFVGPYTGELVNQRAELTGTGDGKLYAMFVTTENEPSQVAEVSKANGGIVSVESLPTVKPGDAYAFSFYGGDFYLYTHAIGAAGSSITRYRPTDKSVTVVKPAIGFKIVGAGVSTCAPTLDIR